jgi:hypothetical protein
MAGSESVMSANKPVPSIISFISLCVAAGAVLAQATKLPPPARTVYKCVVNGKTTFSDEPCLGAEKIDVEPTRGIDKTTGTTRKGADVRNEEFREAVAEAWKPLTGMSAKEFDVANRRLRLEPAARAECAQLDRRINVGEVDERAAAPAQRPTVQRQLWVDRQRHRRLGC